MEEKNTFGKLGAAAFIGWPIYHLLVAGCTQKGEREIFLLFVAYVLALFIVYSYTWINRIHDLDRGSKADKERYEKLLEENRRLRDRQQFIDELDRTLGPGSAETAMRVIRERIRPK